jgi:hypothetical protein
MVTEPTILYGNAILENACNVAPIGPDVRPASYPSSLETGVDDIWWYMMISQKEMKVLINYW